MAFDDVFKSVGDFGLYQKRVYALLITIGIPVGIHLLAHVFLAAETDHWCKNPAIDSFNCSKYALSTEDCIDTIASFKITDNPDTFIEEQHCRRYEFEDEADVLTTNETWSIGECSDGWVYDKSQYRSTIIQDWNLVCDDAAKSALSSSIMFCGVLTGSLVAGSFADHIGRKKVMYICATLVAITGSIASFSPNFWFFCLMRFCVGASCIGSYIMAFVISTEMVGPKSRSFTGVTIELLYVIGNMLYALLGYFLRSWRHLQLVASIPVVLFLLTYPFVPESPRWLVSQRRYKEATDILKKMAKTNGTDLPPEFSDPVELEKLVRINEYIFYKKVKKDNTITISKRHTFVDLFRTPNLRKKSLNLLFNWMVNSLVYYGLSLGTNAMGINDYIAMFLSGAVGVPAIPICLFTANRFGRGKSISFYMISGGIACFMIVFLSKGIAFVSVAMIGKFCVICSFSLIYVFSAEQFPTPVRAVGVGCGSVNARIAGILAPQILFIGKIWEPFPYVIFSVMSLAAGLLILLLPETLNTQLPETLEDGENFGKKENLEKNGRAYETVVQEETKA
ncbi:organic cation transporter protein-like [Antedon mediterranea]|uniref:organic cation transporter protein-like n=1 Tax=Antedon mediterranea TaxID=105859 RepID=UPI003AF86524